MLIQFFSFVLSPWVPKFSNFVQINVEIVVSNFHNLRFETHIILHTFFCPSTSLVVLQFQIRGQADIQNQFSNFETLSVNITIYIFQVQSKGHKTDKKRLQTRGILRVEVGSTKKYYGMDPEVICTPSVSKIR